MKLKLDIDKILDSSSTGLSKWEMDNIVWHERTTNPEVLKKFLLRIKTLSDLGTTITKQEEAELKVLIDLANDLDEDECIELLSDNDDLAQHRYIEFLARKGSLEVLCNQRVSVETMHEMCKLSPEDFILVSKRTQDLINSIKELIIQGETLSQDIAGA
jgi:hypothetical protein